MLNILKILHVYPPYAGWEVNFLVEPFPQCTQYIYILIYIKIYINIFANSSITCFPGDTENRVTWENGDFFKIRTGMAALRSNQNPLFCYLLIIVPGPFDPLLQVTQISLERNIVLPGLKVVIEVFVVRRVLSQDQ